MNKPMASTLIAPLGLLAIWETVARTGIAGLTVPTLTSVAAVYMEPRFAFLLYRSAVATAGSATVGIAGGVVLGIATALAAHLLPWLRPGLDRLAVTVNAIPAIAIAPVFVLLVSRDFTPTLLATIAVFFLIYVAVSSGLRTPSPQLLQMTATFGAGKWQRLRYVEIPSALPSFLSGLKISVTAAVIGAVVGEWFGAPGGLGIVILNTMQNFQIPLLWSAVLLVAVLSLGGYGAAHLVQRYIAGRFS
jgi:NitT/TauT family transport system permease protein